MAQLWADPGEAPAPAEDSGLRGFHFLAAEDNEINAEILTELLEIEGASCEIVENGRLAVERFQEAEAGVPPFFSPDFLENLMEQISDPPHNP